MPDAPHGGKTGLDIHEILKILPHRYPFLLIDRVLDFKRKERIVAIKNVTINEPFFMGHFPGLPIMPGVLIVEAIAQAGGALLLTEVQIAKKVMVFTGIERAKFRKPVGPGDQLRIEVEVKGWREVPGMTAAKMQGYAFVGEKGGGGSVSCQLIDSSRGRASTGAMTGRPLSGLASKTPHHRGHRETQRKPSHPANVVLHESSNIHPTAIIHPTAVPASCKVGPYCVIGADVELGEKCDLVSHVAIEGPSKDRHRQRFFSFCAIGMAPQDVTYKGEPTRLEIGDHNEIREYVTINRGTVKGGGLTKVGSHS